MSSSNITAGYGISFFITKENRVLACGNSEINQISGERTKQLSPVPIQNISNIVEVSASGNHSFYRTGRGEVWAHGSGNYGELGTGKSWFTNRRVYVESTPVMLSLSGIKNIAVGGSHTHFLAAGEVLACGYGGCGQLGTGQHGEDYTVLRPKAIDLQNIKYINAGGNHSLFLNIRGEVWVCGSGEFGQLGTGIHRQGYTEPTPVPIRDIPEIKDISAGNIHSLFLTTEGNVWVCGKGNLGLLGTGKFTWGNDYIEPAPVPIRGIPKIKAISAGGLHSLLLAENGNVLACGMGDMGLLGNSKNPFEPAPALIRDIPKIEAISAGFDHSLFLDKNGNVWVCGSGGFGQLGTGELQTQFAPGDTSHITRKPVPIPGLQLLAEQERQFQDKLQQQQKRFVDVAIETFL